MTKRPLDEDAHKPRARLRLVLPLVAVLAAVAAGSAIGGYHYIQPESVAATPAWETPQPATTPVDQRSSTATATASSDVTGLPVASEIVVVVPHADDESLFAGELLDHYARMGTRIKVVYTTESLGGAASLDDPGFPRARAVVREAVLGRLGTVECTVAPVPDGGGIGRDSGARRRRLVHRFLVKPGVLPMGDPVFVIGGAGNSDHYIAFDEARAVAWSRHQPIYVYWGYGLDKSRLDPNRVGAPVRFEPTAKDRAFKLWAITQYMHDLYAHPPYDRYLPSIMRLPAHDDLVTRLDPGASLAGLAHPAPGQSLEQLVARLKRANRRLLTALRRAIARAARLKVGPPRFADVARHATGHVKHVGARRLPSDSTSTGPSPAGGPALSSSSKAATATR